jgi:hypothetical protein
MVDGGAEVFDGEPEEGPVHIEAIHGVQRARSIGRRFERKLHHGDRANVTKDSRQGVLVESQAWPSVSAERLFDYDPGIRG